MFLAIHLAVAGMYLVLLAPFWLFLGLKLAIHIAHRRGGPKGWLADAEAILNDDPGTRNRRSTRRDAPSGEGTILPYSS